MHLLSSTSRRRRNTRLCTLATKNFRTPISHVELIVVAAVASIFGFDELVSAILAHVDDAHIRQTTLALSRVFPRYYFPLQRFFTPITLTSSDKCVQLQRRLRGPSPDARLVKELRIQSWTVDAEVVSNLLDVLDDLTLLALYVGPNFPPDVLLRILKKPRDGLETLMIRFKPYVQRPNYYQFHAGIYFDSCIGALAKWHIHSLRHLSITQDQHQQCARSDFAQPLVFFNLQPFLELAISETATCVTDLRIRVPGRDVTPFLVVAPSAFPSLKVLDLSTGNIRGSQLVRLLSRFDKLEHLRLDGCAMLAGRDPAEWESLGRECALAGAKKAREKERAIKVWWSEASNALANGGQQVHQAGAPGLSKKAKKGRKGLAAATISLRGAKAPDVPIAGPSFAASPNDITEEEGVFVEALRNNRTIRVLPCPIRLRSLTAHALPPIIADLDTDEDQLNDLQPYMERFIEGWTSGISTLRETWARLRSYSDARFMIVRLTSGASPESPRLTGLQPMTADCWQDLGNARHPAPVLCFYGSEEGGHAEGCGHRETSNSWNDKDFLRGD